MSDGSNNNNQTSKIEVNKQQKNDLNFGTWNVFKTVI